MNKNVSISKLISIFCFGLAVACGGTTGSGGSGGGGTPSDDNTDRVDDKNPPATALCETPASACEQCVADACEQDFCECADDADCIGLVRCLDQCASPEDDCSLACYAQYSEGVPSGVLIGDCAARNCANDCTLGWELDECIECTATTCGEQMTSCFADTDCAALVICTIGCDPSDAACTAACLQDNPAGAALGLEIQVCQQNCAACQ